MKTGFFLMIASIAILSLVSCQKDNTSVEQSSIDIADDETVSDAVFEDIFSTTDNAEIILDQFVKGGDSKSMVLLTDSCPTITITHPEAGIWPKIVTVDFGTGCSGFYDNTRSGRIIIEITGPRLEAGTKRTITFEDYFFNGIRVEGTKVIENAGYNENENLVCSVTLTGGKLTLPDGKTIERSFEHQREWIAGILTPNIWDDECLITGIAHGTTLEGVGYTNTITTALAWKRACFFIVSGVVKIEREGKPEVEINYGTGDCDAKAVVTREGESKEIILRHKIRTMGR